MPTVETKVLRVKQETHDTVTITLDLLGADFKFKPGQAVNIDPNQFKLLAEKLAKLELVRGNPEMPRSFSISSSSCEKRFIQLTIKEEKSNDFEPVLSPYLVRKLKAGDRVEIQGPFGLYTIPADLNGFEIFLHICAGSGIAPNRGIIKYYSDMKIKIKHVLFFQVRSEDDIIYKDEISTWENVKYVPVLSRPSQSWKGAKGYITKEMVAREIGSPKTVCSFLCGPAKPGKNHSESFINKYKNILTSLGIDAKNIKTEVW